MGKYYKLIKNNAEMTMAKIWVDADACPVVIRDIILKAALRTQTQSIFVANSGLPIKRNQYVQTVQVDKGFDVADGYISVHATEADLVVTQDIPLAAEVVEKNIAAINPRGDFYTSANIKQRLAMRNLMTELRDIGQISGGAGKFSDRDKQTFANAFDRWLTKQR